MAQQKLIEFFIERFDLDENEVKKAMKEFEKQKANIVLNIGYSDKVGTLSGDSKFLKDKIKDSGLFYKIYNPVLGWMFAKDKASDVEEFLDDNNVKYEKIDVYLKKEKKSKSEESKKEKVATRKEPAKNTDVTKSTKKTKKVKPEKEVLPQIQTKENAWGNIVFTKGPFANFVLDEENSEIIGFQDTTAPIKKKGEKSIIPLEEIDEERIDALKDFAEENGYNVKEF